MSIVSLGNEIRHGMLWPTGYVEVDTPDASRAQNFSQMASLWASARQGVTDAVNAGVSFRSTKLGSITLTGPPGTKTTSDDSRGQRLEYNTPAIMVRRTHWQWSREEGRLGHFWRLLLPLLRH